VNIHEIDWRIGPLEDIIVGIDAAITAVRERLDAEEIDGLEAREHAELFLGLGFVAFQTYALGTWTDLNRIRQAAGKRPVDKLVCYKTDPILVNQNGPTRIELINAVANYFKHHDEWPREWPEKRDTIITPTIITLKTVGITQKSEFPCIDAACMLCGDGWQLVVLHQIVREWRAHVLKALG
jgi:hypothetical protein